MIPDENRAMDAMTQRELEDLSPHECFQLLATANVGRLVYQDEHGQPLAVPVNYAMDGHDIIFRVDGGAKRTAMQEPKLAFEVDHINEEQHSGWSVLVRGVGAEVSEHRRRTLKRKGPTPWAIGLHKVWLQIVPNTAPGSVTGRRFGEEYKLVRVGENNIAQTAPSRRRRRLFPPAPRRQLQ